LRQNCLSAFTLNCETRALAEAGHAVPPVERIRMRDYPDPEMADLLELLNAAEGSEEIEELLKQSAQPPKVGVTHDENRYAAKVVSLMAKGRDR
jgi:hypothetical protein